MGAGLCGTMVPGAATGYGDAAETLAASLKTGYNFPSKSPRPFAAGYPNGASTDVSGRLLKDIDGRPLTAPFIAGRRSLGGGDEALRPEDVVAGAEGLTGRVLEAVPRSQIPRKAVGAYIERRGLDGPERQILYDKALFGADRGRVISHEFGHAIDELAGKIPVDGLSRELAQIYSTGATGREATRLLNGEAVEIPAQCHWPVPPLHWG
jgi:hypothetical protein